MLQGNEPTPKNYAYPIQEVNATENRSPFSSTLLNQNIVLVEDKQSVPHFGKELVNAQSIFQQSTAIERIINRSQASIEGDSRVSQNTKQVKNQKSDIRTPQSKAKTQFSQVQSKQPDSGPINPESNAQAGVFSPVAQQKRAQNFKDYLNSQTPLNVSKQLAQRTHSPFLNSLSPRQWQVGNMAKMESQISSHKSSFGKRSPLKLETFQNKKTTGKSPGVTNNNQRVSLSQTPDQLYSQENEKIASNLNRQGAHNRDEKDMQNLNNLEQQDLYNFQVIKPKGIDLSLYDQQYSREISNSPSKQNQAQDRRFYNILSSQQVQTMNEYSTTVMRENMFKDKNQKDSAAHQNLHQSNDVAQLKKQKKIIEKRFSHQNRQSNADKLRLNTYSQQDGVLAPSQNGGILIENQKQTDDFSQHHYLHQQVSKAPQTSPTLKLSLKNERILSKLKQDEQRLLQNLSSNTKLIKQNLQVQSPFKNSFAANNFSVDTRCSQNLTDQKTGQPLGSLENNASSNLESKRGLLNQSESQNLYHNRYNMYRNKYNSILKQTLMTESTESQSALNDQHQRTQNQNQQNLRTHQNQIQSSNFIQLNTIKMVEQNGNSKQIQGMADGFSKEDELQAQTVNDQPNTFYQTLDSQARLKSLTTQKKSHTLSNQFEDVESARFAESEDKLLLLSSQNQTNQMKMVPYQDELFQLDSVYGQHHNSKWGLIKDASKRQLSQDISMKGNFEQLLVTNSKFQKTQYYKQAQLNHINRIIDRKSINLEPITQSQEGFLPNIDFKKAQNQSKLKFGKLNQPSQHASNQNSHQISQSQIQGKVKHQISVGGGMSYQGYSNNIKATLNHAMDSKGFNHTKQGRFRQPSIVQGQNPCSQSKEQSMVDIQEISRDDQGDQSQSKMYNQEDTSMLQNQYKISSSKDNLHQREEYIEPSSQVKPQNISHMMGHQNTSNFHLTNFNLKNCLDIKVPLTSVVNQQKQLSTQVLSNQVPLSGATLQLPVPTDKMISYQSFSPANVIKKTKPIKGFGKTSQTQELQELQSEKKGSSLVQKQKFLRQKMKLSQYQHFQGKMIPFQALSSLEMNQECLQQQQITSSPGQMLLTGNNVNRLLESLCSTNNKYSQPYKDTHFSNHQEQFSSKQEMNQMTMQQAALALQNQLSQIHSGMSIQDGQLILEKFGLSLRSSDGREIENLHQKIKPTLMICSMNSVLKSHLQTHSLGDNKPQKKYNNQTLKSSASNQTLPALSPGAKSLVLRDIQSQGEAIDKLDSSLSNFQIKREADAEAELDTDKHNQLNTATEEDDDEEDDQSECLSVKSHDSYQANEDEDQFQNDKTPLTERENNQEFGDRLAEYQHPPHSSSGLNKVAESQNAKVNSKFLTSTKIQLKPIQIQQAQKYVHSQQFQSQTPQSFKPPFKKAINQKEKEVKLQQESKNEMIKRLQARKQEYLQVSLQNQQLILKGKKKKSYGNVLCTVPKNLKDQESQFFASNFTVNPYFQYESYGMTQRYVQEFTFKSDESLLKIAVKIIEAFLKEYGSEKDFIEREGRLLSREETEAYFQKYISDLELEDYLALNFTSKAIAPTSITHGLHGKKSKINICLPIDYSEGRILGVMHHEIGTHFVRKFNDKYQAWAGKRAIFSMMGSLDTEEGLACINQQLENTCFHKGESNLELKPYLFRPALYYYCCHQAQQLSFVDLFADLGKYISDPHRRWKYVMRVKRGLQNTQEPGGFYKDQVYLRGAVEILKNRDKFDLQDLYAGKIAIEDVLMITLDVKKVKLNKDKACIKLPGFLQDMNLYKRAIDEIAKVNFIK